MEIGNGLGVYMCWSCILVGSSGDAKRWGHDHYDHLDRQKVGLFSNPVFSSVKTPITHCGDEPKYGTIAAIDQLGVHVIVNSGGTN